MSNSLHLCIEEQPLSIFYKDEGGKSNQLHFRISLQGGELTAQDVASSNGFIPLAVSAVFENGDLVDRPNVLEVLGGTVIMDNGEQQHTNLPCMSTSSLTGGVRFRISAVSKRLGNRGIGVQVSIPGMPHVEAVTSSTTMVFSKRKNKERKASTAGTPTSSVGGGNRKNSFRFEESDSQSDGEQQPTTTSSSSSTKRRKMSVALPPTIASPRPAQQQQQQSRNIYERIEDLDAEQKKLNLAVAELRKLNQQMQQVRS